MSDLRKRALVELLDFRRRIEALINELSGDPNHREFLRKWADGQPMRVRHVRHYDVPPEPVEHIMARWGVTDPNEGDDDG